MHDAIGFTVLMLAGSVYTVATVAWLAAAYYLFQTMANTRSGVLLWSAALAYFPPNIVFRPDLLTDRGRVFRRRFATAALVCAAAVATGLALSGFVRALA